MFLQNLCSVLVKLFQADFFVELSGTSIDAEGGQVIPASPETALAIISDRECSFPKDGVVASGT